MIRLFIGYDPREAVVYHVCVNSIIRQATQPVAVTPLALKNLSGYVERHKDGSNQFTYSRFLVPHLMGWSGWALYIDGDMLLRTDIAELWSLRDDRKALLCVHHDYKTRLLEKYLGAKNQDYPRKNWSSVMLWNCGHPANRRLTPEFIQGTTGAHLHRFTWLADELVGRLPIEWNWLPDEFGQNPQAKLLHWTLGAPCFHEFADAPMAEEWHRERALVSESIQREAARYG
jgi:lipopolysaccharide biosynthesis glycosyltransferase